MLGGKILWDLSSIYKHNVLAIDIEQCKVLPVSDTVCSQIMAQEDKESCEECFTDEKRYDYSDSGPLFYAYARRVILPWPRHDHNNKHSR